MTRFPLPARYKVALATPFLALAACSDSGPAIEADLAIRNVNVVAMVDETVLPDQTVFIRDGVIVEIAPSGSYSTRDAAVVVKGRDGYLIPGLADMHVHAWDRRELQLYVAHGVTLVRNMWGEEMTLAMRDDVASGELFGPRLVTAGPLTDGDPPIWGVRSNVATTPEQGRASVTSQRAAGYDFFKVYTRLNRETFESIAARARETGFPFAGHVPTDVPLEVALSSGMATIEHLTGYVNAVRPDHNPAPGDESGSAARRQEDANRLAVGELSLADLADPEKTARYARISAEQNVWNVPTLIVRERINTSRRQAGEFLERPEMQFVAPRTKAAWDPSAHPRMHVYSDAELEARQGLLESDYAIVRQLHKAGAPMLAGSDAPNRFVVPGYSIHEELAHFVAAGLKPFDALVTATRAPAEFLGELETSGTIETGKAADLVLLERNPLEDIGATRAIAGVVLAGQWHSEDDLEDRLESLVASYTDWFGSLEPPPGELTQYDLLVSENPIGASRVASDRDGDGPGRMGMQSRWGDPGDPASVNIAYELDADTVFSRIEFSKLERGTSISGTVVIADDLVLMDRTEDGEQSTIELPLGEHDLLLDSSEVGINALQSRLADMAVGDRRTLSAVVLDVDSDLTILPERWTLTREANDGERRLFSLITERDGKDKELTFTYDDGGVVAVSVSGFFGDYTVRRQD